MVVDWAMSTCAETRCVVTANTEGQLRTKTWPEIGKWTRMLENADWWRVPAMSMYEAEHEKSWRADAIPWSENNTEAFAGLHNEGKRVLLVFDEASPISDKVWEVAEGALTDKDTEIIWLAFGNPTRNTGRFRECFGKYRHLWRTMQIDSRTVEGTNRAYLDELVETYGEDSDIVRVRVRGQFPAQAVSQFISSEAVDMARTRRLQSFDAGAPLVLGVDISRFGDDQSVIRGRKGRDGRIIPPIKWRGMDTVFSAGKIAEAINKYQPDAVFIDGGGVGGGVIDLLKAQNYRVTEVNFGAAANFMGWGRFESEAVIASPLPTVGGSGTGSPWPTSRCSHSPGCGRTARSPASPSSPARPTPRCARWWVCTWNSSATHPSSCSCFSSFSVCPLRASSSRRKQHLFWPWLPRWLRPVPSTRPGSEVRRSGTRLRTR